MDGLPPVLTEAMACGVPVVSTRLVGIPDQVRHGRNGLLVEPGDLEALADALDDVLYRPGRAETLGAEAAEWAVDQFSRGETVRRLARLFEWAAAHPGQSPPEETFDPAPGSEAEYQGGTSARPGRHRLAPRPLTLQDDRA